MAQVIAHPISPPVSRFRSPVSQTTANTPTYWHTLRMTPEPIQNHPFDAAIALQALGGNEFSGATHPAWNNMVGPFGGVSAAAVLNTVMQHPKRLGEPVSLTVNFAGALAPGPFAATARPVRTNRSTQHWTVELRQPAPGATASDGQPDDVVLTATVMTAIRRDTWGATDLPMPPVSLPLDTPPATNHRMEWLNRYDLRPVFGTIPTVWEGQAASDDPLQASLSQVWMRDAPSRPLDFCSLAALCDVFFPRILLKRATMTPVGTVSMTVYFHVSRAELVEVGTGYLLGQARAQAYARGFFDQTAQLWSEAGVLVATTHQVVYYKA